MNDYICQQCNKPFRAYAIGGGRPRKFCSPSCWSRFTNSGAKSHLWKGGRKNLTCPQCNKSFAVDPGDKRRKYCSKECHNAARRKRISLICDNCGKEYTRRKSRGNRYSKNYCSMKCRLVHVAGGGNGMWRGGKSFEPYPPTFNERFKRLIRERDNYTCAICNGRGNIVHHINYVKNDTVPENCITVCRSCHGKTNSNRDYWQYTFFA